MAAKEQFATTRDIGQKHNSHVFIEWRALTCPKAEYNADTTEDRWAANAPVGLFAVADGVGSSFRAADWAKALVESWVRTPFRNKFPFEVEWWVRKLQPQFTMSQDEISRLQPFAQDQARKGAGSTLLGLRVWPHSDGKSALYQLLCIGDSDLIHYPRTAFPIANPQDFGSYPTVLRSKNFDRKQDEVRRYPDRDELRGPDGKPPKDTPLQRLVTGETLLLCTDAIAKWALETDKRAWYHPDEVPSAREQLEAQTPDTWKAFVEGLRHAVQIVDDDTTVLFIRVPKDQKSPASTGPDAEGWQRVELSWQGIEAAQRAWSDARRAEMETVRRQNPVSAIEAARVFGDGKLFAEGYKDAAEVKQLAEEGRNRADALDKINEAIRGVTWDNPTREQLDRLANLQQRYAARLADEPAARGALTTMRDLLTRPVAQPPAPPQTPSIPPAPPRQPVETPAPPGMGQPPLAPPSSPVSPNLVESAYNQAGNGPMGGQAAPTQDEERNQGGGAPEPVNGEAERGA